MRHRLGLLALTSAALFAGAHAAYSQTVTFAVPAQPAATGVQQFARQAGLQILVPAEAIAGRRVSDVQGAYEVHAALERLLAGSGLVVTSDDGRTITLGSEPAASRRGAAGRGPLFAGPGALAAPDQPQLATAAGPIVPPGADEPEDVVVTATAGGLGIQRQRASFATTSLNAEDIREAAPKSTADLLHTVPGIWAESSGGQNGANIFVRGFPGGGDAPYVTFQQSGAPVFPPSTLSFLENSQLVRIDDMVERVEAVRGGPAQVFSNGQPGLTVNLLPRTGGPTYSGEAGFSLTDYGEKRFDGRISGPIEGLEDTYFSAGGFYHNGDGVRRTQFDSEDGGQFSANIKHKFGDQGEILIYGRVLGDHGAWLLPIPVLQNGTNISEYPGFDIGTGSFESRNTRNLVLPDGSPFRLGDGRGSNIHSFGVDGHYDITPDLTIADKAGYLAGDADTTGLVSGSAPLSAADEALLHGGTLGAATLLSTGQRLLPSTPVEEVGAWVVRKQVESVTNELSLTWHVGDNKLTGGYYYAHYTSADQWNLGNPLLLEARQNPSIVSLTLANGQPVTTRGFVGGSTFRVNAHYTGEDNAGYLSDEWQATEQLRFDGGIRVQNHDITGQNENNTNTPAGAVLNGTYTQFRYNRSQYAGTAGVDYEFTPVLGAFARYSRGNIFPQFDDLRNGLTTTQTVDSYETGVKYTTPLLRLYATGFYSIFDGIQQTQILTDGSTVKSTGGATSKGIELESVLRPLDGLSLGLNATYLYAAYDTYLVNGTTSAEGNRVQRQPRWQLRATASYARDVGFGLASIYGAFSYVGDRYADELNLQLLPSYEKLDLGVALELASGVALRVSVDNLTDSHGITEGNIRTLSSQGNGVILARPILGRSVTGSITYQF